MYIIMWKALHHFWIVYIFWSFENSILKRELKEMGQIFFAPGLPDGRYIFRPKIAIWVNFGGSCNGRCWYILCTFGVFYGHLIYFMTIWYILWSFGIPPAWHPFWCIVHRKIWQPCFAPSEINRWEVRSVRLEMFWKKCSKAYRNCALLRESFA
jgi:hypothetical protein